MKKIFIAFVLVWFAGAAYSQLSDTTKTAKYQCLTISNIMNQKIADAWLDDGVKNRSVGVKKQDGTYFKSNIELVNFVCKKYNLDLVAVSEVRDVYRFYLKKK